MGSTAIAQEQFPFRTILFCTDFPEGGDPAFDTACALAAGSPGAVLVLLHVIPEPEAQFWKTYIYEVENVDEKAKRDIDAKAEEYHARVPEGVVFDTDYRVGNELEQILACARERGADLLIVRREHRGALESVFLRDIVQRVVRHAPCPALVVPDRMHQG